MVFNLMINFIYGFQTTSFLKVLSGTVFAPNEFLQPLDMIIHSVEQAQDKLCFSLTTD